MEKRNTERIEELPTVETPEDVAVLYSWANLHGAKYRDFSASRREYRAQLRHRAAEQAREQELRAQASAENAATYAEKAARQAEEVAMSNQARDTEFQREQALAEAEEAARVATAERMEAARRAEAAAIADATARREQLEIAEASASARRKAAQYAESESRRGATQPEAQPEVPGEISDPYTPHGQPSPSRQAPVSVSYAVPAPPDHLPPAFHVERTPAPVYQAPQSPRAQGSVDYAPAPVQIPVRAPLGEDPELLPPPPPRRPQGYRPDDASGVRQIYRGPEFDQTRESARSAPARQLIPVQDPAPAGRSSEEPRVRPDDYLNLSQRSWAPPAQQPRSGQDRASAWSDGITYKPATEASANPALSLPPAYISGRNLNVATPAPQAQPAASAPRNSPQGTGDPTPRRRRQDAPGYKEEHPSDSGPGRRRTDPAPYRAAAQPSSPAPRRSPREEPHAAPAPAPEPSGPAWLYASAPPAQAKPAPLPAPPQSSVADTLQHSRERVAARWYALKGVFEQPGQEHAEPAPVRQKETRTPILAVFSMAGGVGKTSLVATLGRSLSSLGEKVLLTDTTSHGLLPFYFGASELRQGTVRTFSPPSGSTDAPIYLVSYDVEGKAGDEPAQEALVEEITASSRGTHRVLLDLTVSSAWIVRHMARLCPTVLVPVAPDMNSVISLQGVEKFFNGVVDADGRPLKIFYLLNQFDASLPLHLDIREVLRRQLGDRLLPFVIRRAPAVGEALAEGMTIVDYSPEAPVAEDYLNAATWLRTVAAPATAGFRNVRWSER